MDYHVTKPVMRQFGNTIAILCEYGHVVTTCKLHEYAHSQLEADYGAGKQVKCGGTLEQANIRD